MVTPKSARCWLKQELKSTREMGEDGVRCRAAWYAKPVLCKVLLGAGADVNLSGRFTGGPLGAVSKANGGGPHKREISRILKAAGADISKARARYYAASTHRPRCNIRSPTRWDNYASSPISKLTMRSQGHLRHPVSRLEHLAPLSRDHQLPCGVTSALYTAQCTQIQHTPQSCPGSIRRYLLLLRT